MKKLSFSDGNFQGFSYFSEHLQTAAAEKIHTAARKMILNEIDLFKVNVSIILSPAAIFNETSR